MKEMAETEVVKMDVAASKLIYDLGNGEGEGMDLWDQSWGESKSEGDINSINRWCCGKSKKMAWWVEGGRRWRWIYAKKKEVEESENVK